MTPQPTNQYVELREGAYYISNTRIGLDILIHDFRRGESPEAILQAYPSLGSLAKVYGAITFILEYPGAIEEYLRQQDARWQEFREKHPLPQDLLERFREAENAHV